jgi:hypothetical protein
VPEGGVPEWGCVGHRVEARLSRTVAPEVIEQCCFIGSSTWDEDERITMLTSKIGGWKKLSYLRIESAKEVCVQK